MVVTLSLTMCAWAWSPARTTCSVLAAGMMGNLQIGFPSVAGGGSALGTTQQPVHSRPHTVIMQENWNMNCIRCHTTGPQPKPNKVEQRFESQIADLGISCEACHGPGQNHVDRQLPSGQTPRGGTPTGAGIRTPGYRATADLDHTRSTQVCGSCHGMKWFDKSEDWTAHGFSYRPGDDLAKTTPIIQPTQLDKQPWLKPVLEKNPHPR